MRLTGLGPDDRVKGDRPTVLIMSWYGPGRRDAGEKIRLAAMAEALAGDFRVHWGLIDGRDAERSERASSSIFDDVPKFHYRMRPVDYVRALVRFRAIEADRLAGHARVRAWASDLIAEVEPDVIWVNQPFAWLLVPRDWRGRAILDTHNVNSARLERIAQSRRVGPGALVALVQSRLTRRFERMYVREAAATVAVSRDDAAKLSAPGGTSARVAVVPNGAHLLPHSRTRLVEAGDTPKLLFLGSLTYSANVDALRVLAGWLAGSNADAVVTVAGSGASDEVRSLCERTPQFEFVGRVDDARAAMAEHHALIAPHSQGGGSRIKVLEALATRLPVIGTAVAVEGLEMTPGVDYLFADSAESFRRAVDELKSPGRAEDIANSGWRIATANQWTTLGREASALAVGVCEDYASLRGASGGAQ